jgi:DNA-binding MarR family transcriptional regulator
MPQLARAERRFRLATRDYAQLAAFRHALRAFLQFSEEAAAAAGLTARHYQAMLALRGCPEDQRMSIADLAKQLVIKHNSAVGLVDRLEQEKLIVRRTSRQDRRKVELTLTPRGRQVLATLAAMHRRELVRIGPALQRFCGEVSRLGRGNGAAATGARASAKGVRASTKGARGAAKAPRRAGNGQRARRAAASR